MPEVRKALRQRQSAALGLEMQRAEQPAPVVRQGQDQILP